MRAQSPDAVTREVSRNFIEITMFKCWSCHVGTASVMCYCPVQYICGPRMSSFVYFLWFCKFTVSMNVITLLVATLTSLTYTYGQSSREPFTSFRIQLSASTLPWFTNSNLENTMTTTSRIKYSLNQLYNLWRAATILKTPLSTQS